MWREERWVARVEVVERWGGRGEGVRVGWERERAWRRGGEVRAVARAGVLGGVC